MILPSRQFGFEQIAPLCDYPSNMSSEIISETTLVPWLQRFVRHPSEQSALQEDDPRVQAFISECVAPVLTELGIAPLRYDDGGNLVVELGPAGGTPSILFATYAMTHPAAAMEDPFSASLLDGPEGPVIRGRGVAEQKTALTAAIGAIAQAHRDGLKGRVILTVLSAGETGRHDAIASVMDMLETPPDCAIVCLGTDNRIGRGNKGRLDIEITVRGKTSHSSTPWQGINAITGARQCLSALEEFTPGVRDHPAFGPATLTPTAIRSGPEATHTIQDTVRMMFDRRLLPGENPDTAFEKIVAALPTDGPWKISCARGPFMYPNEVDADGRLMKLLQMAYGDAGFDEAGTVNCNFALDAGYFAHLGIEAVMLGPGHIDQFHSGDESVLVSDLMDMTRVYHALIHRALAP